MKHKIELAKHYEKLLTAEQFIVTGSTALKLHGLDVHSDDLDIILVNPSTECQESLRKLNTLKGDYSGGCACQFEQVGIKIDIFIESKPKTCCSYDGIQINPVKDIVAAKNRIGRPKDVDQLTAISATLSPEPKKQCTPTVYEKYHARVKAFYELSTLCDAWNKQDNFVPDLDDPRQNRWYPVFSSAGCCFSFSNDAPSFAFANVGSRLCFKSRERSDEFGKKYEELFKTFLRG
jgi:hypothetical protein